MPKYRALQLTFANHESNLCGTVTYVRIPKVLCICRTHLRAVGRTIWHVALFNRTVYLTKTN